MDKSKSRGSKLFPNEQSRPGEESESTMTGAWQGEKGLNSRSACNHQPLCQLKCSSSQKTLCVYVTRALNRLYVTLRTRFYLLNSGFCSYLAGLIVSDEGLCYTPALAILMLWVMSPVTLERQNWMRNAIWMKRTSGWNWTLRGERKTGRKRRPKSGRIIKHSCIRALKSIKPYSQAVSLARKFICIFPGRLTYRPKGQFYFFIYFRFREAGILHIYYFLIQQRPYLLCTVVPVKDFKKSNDTSLFLIDGD